MLKPINKKVWPCSDGAECATLEDAKEHEIHIAAEKSSVEISPEAIRWIVANCGSIGAILGATERVTKPKVGRPPGSRNRKANAAPVVPAQS